MTPNEQKADTPEVTRAAEVLREKCDAVYTGIEHSRTLSAAGLIVTDLHKRALAACEAYALCITPKNMDGCCEVGLESLAAKKPKERFVVVDGTSVCENVGDHRTQVHRATFHGSDAKPRAVAYAAQCNAEEGK